MEPKNQPEVIVVAGKGGKHRWLAITALFLAIGTILRLATPSMSGVITPNWTIAMYCLVMILVKPSLRQAVGIGFVAGCIALVTSKSMFPYANVLSEMAGASVACLLVQHNIRLGFRERVNLQPALVGMVATLISGLVFTTSTKLALSIPMSAYLYIMLPTVAVVAAINTVVTQLLYFPAYKIFSLQAGNQSERDQ